MFMAATAKDRLLGVALNDVGPKLEQAGLDIISDYLGRRPAAKTHAEAAEVRTRTAIGFANDHLPLVRGSAHFYRNIQMAH